MGSWVQGNLCLDWQGTARKRFNARVRAAGMRRRSTCLQNRGRREFNGQRAAAPARSAKYASTTRPTQSTTVLHVWARQGAPACPCVAQHRGGYLDVAYREGARDLARGRAVDIFSQQLMTCTGELTQSRIQCSRPVLDPQRQDRRTPRSGMALRRRPHGKLSADHHGAVHITDCRHAHAAGMALRHGRASLQLTQGIRGPGPGSGGGYGRIEELYLWAQDHAEYGDCSRAFSIGLRCRRRPRASESLVRRGRR